MTTDSGNKDSSAAAASAQARALARYRRAGELYWRAPTQELLRRVTAKDPDLAVLDVGFGQGHSTVWLELATDAARVDCIDCSTAGAGGLRAAFRRHFPNVKLRVVRGAVGALPYRSESFDVVFCRSVLEAAGAEAAVGELRRVLRPEGKALVVAELGENPFARGRGGAAGMVERQALRYGTICEWREKGLCAFHAEYHLVTPALFPLLAGLGSGRMARMILAIARMADALVVSRARRLRRYCRFSFIEIVK